MDQPIAMELPMAHHTADSHISLHLHTRRVCILDGDTLIPDTRNGIELLERGYPQRPELQKEFPRADVDMSVLLVSTTVSHCPFKGDTTYESPPVIADVAWSYEPPFDEMQSIAGQMASDTGKVIELLG